MIAYLSLGANLGDRLANLQSAINKLHASDMVVTRVSPVYETAPIDFLEQPDFFNIVIEVNTKASPMEMLRRVGEIERELGRERTLPKGPRSIDLDILFYGDAVICTDNLQIPHPRLEQRRFVLQPLNDLAPELVHPVTSRTVKELLAGAPDSFLRATPLCLNLPGVAAEHGP